MTPTLSLNDPPKLDGKCDAVEEGGGEADDDGRGEEGAAAAGVQEGHRQNCPFFPNSQFVFSLRVQDHFKGLAKTVPIRKSTIFSFTQSGNNIVKDNLNTAPFPRSSIFGLLTGLVQNYSSNLLLRPQIPNLWFQSKSISG